jgi:WD40 repeat protein
MLCGHRIERQVDKALGRGDGTVSQGVCESKDPSVIAKVPRRHLSAPFQNGHDNWIRALTFHPSGKYLLSASDDKTIRIWDLETGRMSKTIDAHEHFVTCMVWGRTTVGGGTTINGAGKETTEASTKRRVNVLATGSVDQTIRVSVCEGVRCLRLIVRRLQLALDAMRSVELTNRLPRHHHPSTSLCFDFPLPTL